MRKLAIALVFFMFLPAAVKADDRLILDLELDEGLLSLTHHIENFLFDRTASYSKHLAGDLNERIKTDTLKDYLVATALVKMNGEIVGLATEQEYVYLDAATGIPIAKSAWLISLNHPKMTGVFAVEQIENAAPVFGLVSEVVANPQKDWPDKFQRFLSTSSDTRITMASEGLARYKGAKFEEFNYVNPADLGNLGRFRAKIQFVITPNR
ncbi:MAG: hypothetical protein JRH15_00545 [Deltaproteobacteria bacterium]|nr:hypothetical protein [Deltaproteobacteria bacterium]